MTTNARQSVIESVWYGQEPFLGFPRGLYQTDIQGWQSGHPYLREAVAAVRPRIVVEIGVWKGASAITLASALKDLAVDGVVIAVDTWLGSWDHWLNRQWFDHLAFEAGMPQLYRKFVQNVVDRGVDGYVVPLPLDSANAQVVLSRHNLSIDVLHIDAAHNHSSVMSDLRLWWPLLRPGGILLGDDYTDDGAWPEVREAYDEFFASKCLTPIEHFGRKCRVKKPVGQDATVAP